MHDAAFYWLRDALDNHLFDVFYEAVGDGECRPRSEQQPQFLEFGSRDINGTARDALPIFLRNKVSWLGIDLVEGPGVDLVAEAAGFRYHDFTQGKDGTEYVLHDVVVCTEVLEHSDVWPLIIANAHRHLRPGGWLFLTCAGPGRLEHSAVDGLQLRDGEHYANVSPQELNLVLRDDWSRWRIEYVAETPDEARPNGIFDTYAWAVR